MAKQLKVQVHVVHSVTCSKQISLLEISLHSTGSCQHLNTLKNKTWFCVEEFRSSSGYRKKNIRNERTNPHYIFLNNKKKHRSGQMKRKPLAPLAPLAPRSDGRHRCQSVPAPPHPHHLTPQPPTPHLHSWHLHRLSSHFKTIPR